MWPNAAAHAFQQQQRRGDARSMIGAGSLLSLLVSLPRWPLVRLLLVPAQALAAVGSAMGNLLCLHDG